MVSKARLDLPEPERPVITMSLSRGIATDMFLRLCTRAPCTAMVVRAILWGGLAVCAPAGKRRSPVAGLVAIRRLPHIHERQFLHRNVALLRELDGRRRLADEPFVGQVLAGRGDPLDVEVALEVGFNLGCRPRFAHRAQ